MKPGFATFLSASERDRRDAFLGTARRLGTVEQNAEKDFWVCWTLAALFQDQAANKHRLLFKGGTSLSKAFSLISRFSEDIDVTVFRSDLGQDVSVEELEALSGRKRRDRLDAIKAACRDYVHGEMRQSLQEELDDLLRQSDIAPGNAHIEIDPDDPDGQSLLVWYPTTTAASAYVRPAVKIESGAKSALDPHVSALIRPYVADDVQGLDLTAPHITTVAAERTFWDKVVILHGLRRWFERRGKLRADGHRVSRHYYDVHLLSGTGVGKNAVADPALGTDCVRHANMFFGSPDLDLASAHAGSFALSPTPEMVAALERDYRDMSGMIFGESPSFADVLESIRRLEQQLNGG